MGKRLFAFVLIIVMVGAESRAAHRIAEINGVRELHGLTGDIDLIAKVEAHDMDELSKIINQIRKSEGVQGTDTRIVLTTVLSLKT